MITEILNSGLVVKMVIAFLIGNAAQFIAGVGYKLWKYRGKKSRGLAVLQGWIVSIVVLMAWSFVFSEVFISLTNLTIFTIAVLVFHLLHFGFNNIKKVPKSASWFITSSIGALVLYSAPKLLGMGV